MDTEHYEKLIEDYKSKYTQDVESYISEEHTEVRSASVLTDPFSDTVLQDDKNQLLQNLLKELNKLAEEEDEEEEVIDTLDLSRRAKKKMKKRDKEVKEQVKEEAVEAAQEADDEGTTEGEKIAEEEVEEEGEEREEVLGEDYIDEEEAQADAEKETPISKEVLMKRAYIYQVLDSLIPEYEEELQNYIREGETELLAEDLPVILQSFGANPSKQQCASIVQKVKDEGGTMSFLDFLELLARLMKDMLTTDDVLEAFKMLDLNNNGEIPVAIVREVLTSVGERLSDEEMALLIAEGDPDGEGVINYEQLVRRMERNLYVATPSKRKMLIKILRKEDRRKHHRGGDEEDITPVDEMTAEEEEEIDPIFGTPVSK